MSRNHARIEGTSAGWTFRDLGSRNGAFVDGKVCAPNGSTLLRDGSVIRVGDTILVFRASALVDDARSDAAAFPGASPAATDVRRRLDLLAKAPGHALVLGETGTGKERVARALAQAGPFVTQNCAELTRELARSELFGHVRGAFSGAAANKPGLVDQAGEGTLFLDEVGELPIDVQGDLLRFLEDGSYRAVGGGELRHSRARIVAATNVDVDQAVASGRFRRDLVARLRASNAPLELPPLRERSEDLPQWVATFLVEAGHVVPSQMWGAGVIECLLLYPWPENLRELRGLVRSIAGQPEAFPWTTEQLPMKLRSYRTGLRGPQGEARGDEPEPVRPDPTQVEIEDALARTQGRVRTAANQLGIDRRKLYRLCERFGIALEAHRDPSSGATD
jgi:DNA-binding NtrC family response regulator